MRLQNVPLLEVQARWGYSELTDSPAARHYSDLGHLVAKRSSGTSFELLSEAEQYELAFGTACARPVLLAFLTGVISFDIVRVGRARLGSMLVPPNVWYPESEGRFVSFEEYMRTTGVKLDDPRSVLPKGPSYEFPTDPITFGRSFSFPILIDGFHRAARFWKYGPSDGKLLAYFPSGLVVED
ncbi:hypothetical protein [Bradyrhizobium sp. th.b2]|uniref:hypothetical protein n=1 Tax=Bradyrhizobium sp. th-b2 TaxID=172088 RepID=UPI0012EB06F3|nr:hypothetical protein [Bradyrhizobium sp. th.b2]